MNYLTKQGAWLARVREAQQVHGAGAADIEHLAVDGCAVVLGVHIGDDHFVELEEFEQGASLVVIGKRGEHVDFAKGHLGSNLERVIRSAKIPVLVAAREFKQLHNFLLAFDGGPSSLKAVHHAATNPLLQGLDCHLIMVGRKDHEHALALDHAATGLRGAGFTVTADLLPGDPDGVIAAQVKQRDIGLLVMGAYGHSRVRQLILGSTTTNLIRTCLVPVILFR